ncbi:uncharacterized protein KRP23_6872 [Phytophthora ramorum]|uniref:uncharacterized protein n=1 Tax=Phytophthora ramorum TaxID=164328 RepID=UPI0030A30637|nr:hypothetical protein KRP23_6872 [Phytophthora ramorum]
MDNKDKLSHVKFLKQLHLELTQLQESDWDALRNRQGTPTKRRAQSTRRAHVPLQVDEWRPGNGKTGRKRRQRACKVCSLLKGTDESEGGETTHHCSTCKLKTTSEKPKASRVYLCTKVKHTHNGESISCFEIWHRHWRNGTLLPPSRKKRKIRARTPADNEESKSSEESSNEGSTSHPKRARPAVAAPTS